MIDTLRDIIHRNWKNLDQTEPFDPGGLSFTKFCQRIVGEHTKVLFYVTYNKKPLCLLKIMRSAAFNQKLKNEAHAQKTLLHIEPTIVSRIYFEDTVDDLYVYSEEIVPGLPISRARAKQKEEEIVSHVTKFPVYGEVGSHEVAGILEAQLPRDNTNVAVLLQCLQEKEVVLKKGLTHSDFGRPNILYSHGAIRIIDWERANERPFWLIDAVYFLVKLRKISNLREWEQKGLPVFADYTGVDAHTARALYSILMLFEILYKKYREQYTAVSKQFSFDV